MHKSVNQQENKIAFAIYSPHTSA